MDDARRKNIGNYEVKIQESAYNNASYSESKFTL